jgi:YVTN family beta-propeller protein
VALTPDGALLVTVNPGSNSVSFVDTASASVIGTAQTGEEPAALLLDRGGRRAYVLNRRSASMTVIDVPSRAVAATVATDPEPVRAQLSRDGTRLHLIARGSAYLTTFSVPELAVVRTVFLGLGAGALKVDPRTDLIYVGRTDEGRIQVFDPISALPVDSIAVPGPVAFLALDHVENTLVAVLPTRAQVAFVDLTRKRLVAALELAGEPFQVVLADERL